MELFGERRDKLFRQPGSQTPVRSHLFDQPPHQARRAGSRRRVVLVHQMIGLLPYESGGERRWRGGFRLRNPDHPRPQLTQHPFEVLEIVFVLEAGSPGLQEYRKVFVLHHRSLEFFGTKSGEPQGGSRFEGSPGEQQRCGRTDAEESPKVARRLQFFPQGRIQIGGGDEGQQFCWRKLVRQISHDGVITDEYFQRVTVSLLPDP
jgi:hypothetical protein